MFVALKNLITIYIQKIKQNPPPILDPPLNIAVLKFLAALLLTWSQREFGSLLKMLPAARSWVLHTMEQSFRNAVKPGRGREATWAPTPEATGGMSISQLLVQPPTGRNIQGQGPGPGSLLPTSWGIKNQRQLAQEPPALHPLSPPRLCCPTAACWRWRAGVGLLAPRAYTPARPGPPRIPRQVPLCGRTTVAPPLRTAVRSEGIRLTATPCVPPSGAATLLGFQRAAAQGL